MACSKERFLAWQSSLLALGLPPNVVQRKVLLVCADPAHLRALRAADPRVAAAALPAAAPVPMFHAGSRDTQLVTVGLDRERAVYKAAATDLGGLSNARWPLGERPAFTRVRSGATPGDVYAEWKRLSGRKAFSGSGHYGRMRRWLGTVPPGHALGFAPLPPQPRHVMTARRAKELTGRYFVRTFAGDDARYARPADQHELGSLFAALDPKGFVTPNLNRANLLNEYSWTDTGRAVTAGTLARDVA